MIGGLQETLNTIELLGAGNCIDFGLTTLEYGHYARDTNELEAKKADKIYPYLKCGTEYITFSHV